MEACDTSQRVDTGLGSSEPGQVRGATGSQEIRCLLAPGPPSLFQALLYTLLWKPQKTAWPWELQGKGLDIPMSQKVRQSSSQQKTDGTFKTWGGIIYESVGSAGCGGTTSAAVAGALPPRALPPGAQRKEIRNGYQSLWGASDLFDSWVLKGAVTFGRGDLAERERGE